MDHRVGNPIMTTPRSTTPRSTTHRPAVIALDDAGNVDAAELGAKAHRLAALRLAGRPVPDGAVLSTSFLRSADPVELAAAVEAVWHRLGPGPLAVRSSAVAEDRADASFAGLYETVLDVVGVAALTDAVEQVVASATAGRVRSYDEGAAGGAIAVLIQPMLAAECAGVAFGADPVTGDRDTVVISAVAGIGERLVSGEADGEDWVVDAAGARLRTGAGDVLDAEQVVDIATLVSDLSTSEGLPQDIEWAIADGRVHLLQARPMTALPEPVSWETSVKAPFWRRDFRLGEWLPDPVTPLFETWLLPEQDRGFLQVQLDEYGGASEPPYNLVVNGWCYSGLGRPGPRTGLVLLKHPVRMVRWFVAFNLLMKGKDPVRGERWMADPARDLYERKLGPAYRTCVEHGASIVETAPVADLVSLVDDVAHRFGALGFVLAECAGFAWKAEFALACFYDEHLRATIGGSYQELLAGLREPTEPAPHAVATLDWSQPTLGERDEPAEAPSRSRYDALVETRLAAEGRCREVLTNAKIRATFDAYLDVAQRYAVIREAFVADMTIGWPLMRRALLGLGTHAVDLGVIDRAEDVFWLTRSEVDAVVTGDATQRRDEVDRRRQQWERQRRLSPPVWVGKPGHADKQHARLSDMCRSEAVESSEHAIVGVPSSPGRVTGPVRVILHPDQFDEVEDGDVLVAPLTTPAWTPLFARVGAVVTDGGSLAAHASLIAREYGIPAVVATGDATTRLVTGDLVTVDGGRGSVELTPPGRVASTDHAGERPEGGA